MNRAWWVLVPLVLVARAGAEPLKPVRVVGGPMSGHIHPSICLTSKGTLVVIYGRVEARDLRVTRSTDGGRTWEPSVAFEHTLKRTYYPGSLTALSDGRILHAWNRWSTPEGTKEPRYVEFSLSADEGKTWSEPRELPKNTVMSVIRHPAVELSAGKWLFSLSDKTIVFDEKSGESKPFGSTDTKHGLVPIVKTPKGTFISGAALRSTDAGATWTPIAKFPDIKSQGWRHEMMCLADGRLLASEILGPGFGGERIRYAMSSDDGLTWESRFEYYNPGRAIGGRACPRTVQLDADIAGVVFYDIDPKQDGGPGLFFLRIPTAGLGK